MYAEEDPKTDSEYTHSIRHLPHSNVHKYVALKSRRLSHIVEAKVDKKKKKKAQLGWKRQRDEGRVRERRVKKRTCTSELLKIESQSVWVENKK